MNLRKLLLSSTTLALYASDLLPVVNAQEGPTCWECGITADNIDLYNAIDPNVDGTLTTFDLVIFTKFWKFTLGEPEIVCTKQLYAIYQNGNGPQDQIIAAMIDYILLAGEDSCVVFDDMISCLQKVILGVCPIKPSCETCDITEENLWKWNAIDPSLDGGLSTFDLALFGQLWQSMGTPPIVCLNDLYDIYQQGNGSNDPIIAAFIDYIIELVEGDCVGFEFMTSCLQSVILSTCP